MPFYDGIGVIAEKHAVVLEVGTSLTKVGYAGESMPRAILRTPPEIFASNSARRRSSDGVSTAGIRDTGEDDEDDALVSFVHRLYFEHLLVNPKDRRVVLVESVLGDVRIRDRLVRALFRHFEVLSVLLAPSHLMPLFCLGLEHALVLDAGNAETTLLPVYQGVPVLKAWQALPLGASAVHGAIRKGLAAQGDSPGREAPRDAGGRRPDVELDEEVVEDIKVRLCFATEMTRGHTIQQARVFFSPPAPTNCFRLK